jgi:hypothetical protein
MKRPPKILNRIVDKVLAYKPKPKIKKGFGHRLLQLLDLGVDEMKITPIPLNFCKHHPRRLELETDNDVLRRNLSCYETQLTSLKKLMRERGIGVAKGILG